jgi:hypothetical protein
MSIRVVLADDNVFVREGVRALWGLWGVGGNQHQSARVALASAWSRHVSSAAEVWSSRSHTCA